VQGNFREHAAMLLALGEDVVEVRLPEQLEGLDALVIPGGESTAITRLVRRIARSPISRRGSRVAVTASVETRAFRLTRP